MKKNFDKKPLKEKTEKPPVNENSFPLIASKILFIVVLLLCLAPTARIVRIFLNGDGIERVKWNFNIDGVMTKWGYACWPGPSKITTQILGIPYEEQVNEIIPESNFRDHTSPFRRGGLELYFRNTVWPTLLNEIKGI